MTKIALIIESSARKSEPMPAYAFYRSPQSQWVNSIMDYLEATQFPQENTYFLSFYQHRVIPYGAIAEPYPSYKRSPSISAGNAFAPHILSFLQEAGCSHVDIHAGQNIAQPLSPLLEEAGISYTIYAAGVSLGEKPVFYRNLTQEYMLQRRVKEIQEQRWHVVKEIEQRSAWEAEHLLASHESKGAVLGIEDEFQRLRAQVKKFRERERAAKRARDEVEALMNQHSEADELADLFSYATSIPALLDDSEAYRTRKQRFGKELAKYTRYLIKEQYAKEAEKEISHILLRIQIVMLKKTS